MGEMGKDGGWGCREAFLTLGTVQFEPLVAFYQGLLGQAAQPYLPDRYAEFTLPGMKLALFRPQIGHRAEFDQPSSGGMSLCLEVEDLEGAIAHLAALGYPPPGPILTASHGREVYAYDPDGNRLILHQSATNPS
jgi:catechol 2,3-dioxygenase-like lactoylglutathione lyase family enzyme